MISKAVDLVARKLAGLDPETINRITQILGEEAQAISDEMQSTGEKVDADILAARLDGIVARIKYEVRNQVGSMKIAQLRSKSTINSLNNFLGS